MKLNELSPAARSFKSGKRKGRGVGSGNGKTAGRGTKVQNSRTGGGVRQGFEGGPMPIHRRLTKRGFKNILEKKILTVNIRDLKRFERGSFDDETARIGCGLVKGERDGIKLLGHGEIAYPLTVKLNEISDGARKKIEAAGGNVEVV